jgi:hypothetical protein
MQRWKLSSALPLLAVFAACGGGSSLPAPEPPPEGEALSANLHRLLELSELEGVLGARARAFTRQVAIMIGDPSDAELEDLVDAVYSAFDYGSLRADVHDELLAEATLEATTRVLEWMEGGATAAVRRIGEEYEPEQSLQEYAAEMTDEPPSEARIQLVSAWGEARGEGLFFVLVQEALREASYSVVDAMRPGTVGPFEPLSGDELELAQVNSHGAGVIRLLHGYAPAPDQLIRRATAEYASEEGQWFVDSYTLAVARAVRSAGLRAAEQLQGGA